MGDAGGSTGGHGLAAAYAHLNRRERTVAEMRSHLERVSVPEGEIEAVIAELVGDGYLDDARYARVFAQDKRTLESWGSERIARALATRGIERGLIAAAVDADDGSDDGERALELLRRRFGEPPATMRDRERALGMLVRKGYDSDVAYDAVRAWAEVAGDR